MTLSVCQFQELALNIDIAPTFAELAANVSLNNVDGKSLVPILHPTGRNQPLRDTFLIEYFGEFGGLYHDCDQYIGEPVFVSSFARKHDTFPLQDH